MANVNTFADVINRQNNGQPIVLSATTTLHQSFQLGGSAALLTVPLPMSSIDTTQNFPGFAANARPFKIRAAGQVTGGEQYAIDINQGSGLTPQISTTGLVPNGRQFDIWLLEILAMWDPNSNFLRGYFEGFAGPATIAQAALSSVVQPANLAALTFNVAVTIASANPNASFSLTEFSAEYV